MKNMKQVLYFTSQVRIHVSANLVLSNSGLFSHSAVVSTLSDDIENVSVALGEPATLSCPIMKWDTNYTIRWEFDGDEYNCDRSDTNIYCSTTDDDVSTLHIKNTTLLGVGIYRAQCILRPNIPKKFMADCGSIPGLCDDITREATLEIRKEEPSVSGESFCAQSLRILTVVTSY